MPHYDEEATDQENIARALFHIGDQIGQVADILNYPVKDLTNELCSSISGVAEALNGIASAIDTQGD